MITNEITFSAFKLHFLFEYLLIPKIVGLTIFAMSTEKLSVLHCFVLFVLLLFKIKEMGKFSDIVKSEIPTLVDFYATWCGPCQTMHPIMDRLKDDLGNKVRILKIDIDKNSDVAEKFKIRGVPTFILFKKGEILWRQSGVIDINTLKNKIKQAI